MKNKLPFSILVLTTIILATSCKKDEGTNSNSNVTTIIGKWTFNSEISWSTPTGSATQKDTSAAHTGEYADFRTDGKVYSYNWHNSVYSYDTSDFVVNGSRLIFTYPNAGYPKSDTFEIKTLTSSKLSIYDSYTKNGVFEELWGKLQQIKTAHNTGFCASGA